MSGITRPAREAYLEQIENLEKQVRALQTQQQFVITDPTKSSGDPEHGYAIAVLGNLKGYGALTGHGVASYKTGTWIQL